MDIVARLRMWAEWDYMTESASADLVIAANEIEKLREERNRLREALQEIAKSQPSECEQAFNFKMIARAALKEKE